MKYVKNVKIYMYFKCHKVLKELNVCHTLMNSLGSEFCKPTHPGGQLFSAISLARKKKTRNRIVGLKQSWLYNRENQMLSKAGSPSPVFGMLANY